MAKVFGGSSNCSSGGPQKILPTSSDAVSSSNSQTFSSQPNVYSKSPSITEGINVRDYYNKSDINKLLKAKVDIGNVYDKIEVDNLLSTLEKKINLSIDPLVTNTELKTELDSLTASLLAKVQTLYYEKSSLYTKTEVDSLISAVQVDTSDFVIKTPAALTQNKIDPGNNSAIPLTLIGSKSSTVDVIQQWIDSQSNSIGRVRNSGQFEYYGNLVIGQNVGLSEAAINSSNRRITGVADPVENLDAINKKYMEDFITKLIDAIVQGDNENYVIDALEY